jgi:hypothetical protein
MKKTFYKITNRTTHPSIAKNMTKNLQEGKEVRLKLMDAGSFRNLELIHKQILKASDDNVLEVFMYPERNLFHPQGKVDKWIFSTKKEKKDTRRQAVLSFLSK